MSKRSERPRRAGTLRLVAMVTMLAVALLPASAAGTQENATLAEGLVMSDPVTPLAVVIDPDDIRPSGGEQLIYPEGEPAEPGGIAAPTVPIVDTTAQVTSSSDGGGLDAGSIDALSAPIVNVPGTTSNANPPDTTGDVGPNHYVQMHNAGPTGGQTVYQVFDKLGADASGGAIRFGGLWPTGDICNSDLGDPIVVYDHLADRWLLSQFANPTHMCFAISQTPDPLANSWFLYTYNVSAFFPDYPKIGVWPDGYYMSTYESQGDVLGVYVFDRANMLLGNAAGFFRDSVARLGAPGVRDTRILPADLDGPVPPAGTPNYFVRTVDHQQDPGNPTDRLEIYEYDVDWSVPTASFSLVQTIDGAGGLRAFDVMTCNRNLRGTRDCIPQPDSQNTLDSLSNRPMMQLKYRVIDGEEVMVFNQTIDVSGSIEFLLGFPAVNEVAGIRWYQLNKPPAGSWLIDQQGTYAPQPNGADSEDELLHRWMGSAAIDKDGNLAIGYSITNSDDTNGAEVYPGLRYAGRRFDDSANLLPQPERTILDGTASQSGGTNDALCLDNNGNVSGCRWGDYSSLSVDPVDDCTFWYTNHVAGPNNGPRPTQIASFRFDTCGTDLAIGKTVTPAHPNAGEEIVYTVTVRNDGPSDAHDVVVTDTLPPELRYLANTDSCTGVAVGSTGTLTCELGTVPAGQARSFQIKGQIDPDLGGATSITNTATVSSSGGDTDPSDNTISLTHLVNELADIRVTKLCKPDSQPAPAGTSGVCSILVTNDGPSAARDVELADQHFSDGTFTLGTPTASQGSCTVTHPSVDCSLGKIQPGATAQVDVPVSSNEGVDVNDVAQATAATPDPNSGNNSATAGVSFAASADLVLTKTGPASATAGTEVVYTLTLDNLGPSTATGVTVTDNLPSGVDFVSATPSVGTVNASGGTVTWNVGTVAPADPARTLEIRVFIRPETTGQLVNNASATSQTSDPDTGNNLAQLTTVVESSAGLTLTKSDSPDPVVAGDELTYTVTVGNNGPSTATDVVVTDTLPASVDLVSVHPLDPSVTCAEVQQGTVVCDVGSLDPGDTSTIFITVLVDSSVPDGSILVNTVEASSPQDPDGAQDSEETAVVTSAELWMEKVGTATAGNPSGAITYRLTVHNKEGSAPDDTPTSGSGGPSDAQNVVVTDALPLDSKKVKVQFLSPGCTYDQPTHTVTCSTATLPAGTSVTFEVQVQVNGSSGTLSNTASVTSSTPDPVAGNNSDTEHVVVQGGSGKGKSPS